jgi:hypothetical protein
VLQVSDADDYVPRPRHGGTSQSYGATDEPAASSGMGARSGSTAARATGDQAQDRPPSKEDIAAMVRGLGGLLTF